MKKLLVVMVITLMMASGAYALQADWQVDANVVAVTGTVQTTGAVSVGAYSPAFYQTLDGLDDMDTAIPGGNILAGLYEIDIVNGAMGAQSQTDFIAIPSAATDVDLWTIKVSVVGGAAGVPVKLNAVFNDWSDSAPITDSAFNVYLFAGQLTKAQAAAATPIWGGSLANYSAFKAGLDSNPFTLGPSGSQYFTLWAGAAIPEPGSMLALFSGLVGLVGFGIRRRR